MEQSLALIDRLFGVDGPCRYSLCSALLKRALFVVRYFPFLLGGIIIFTIVYVDLVENSPII